MLSQAAQRLILRTGQRERPRSAGGTFPWWTVVLGVFFVVWEGATRGGHISPIVLPAPSAVAIDLAAHWRLFAIQSCVTLVEIVVGFAASLLIAVPLAMLLSSFSLVQRCLYPIIVGSQTVPVVSIAPVLLAWFGFGLLPKVLVVILITFFPIMMNTYAGMKGMSELVGNLARSTGATRMQLFWHFQLPGALPALFSGMKVAITLAVVGAVVAEFVGSDSGLGYEITVAGSNLNLAHQFAAIAMLSAMGMGLFSLMARVERLCLPWHISVREQRHDQ